MVVFSFVVKAIDMGEAGENLSVDVCALVHFGFDFVQVLEAVVVLT